MEAAISRVIDKTYLCWTVDVVLAPSSSSLLIFCSSSLLSSKNFSLSSVNVQINRFTWKTPTHCWCRNLAIYLCVPVRQQSGTVCCDHLFLQLLNDAAPLCCFLKKLLLGLMQHGLCLNLLFHVLTGWDSRGKVSFRFILLTKL